MNAKLTEPSTNVFGPLNVNRAFLPYMRERKSGTVVWIGSIGGWRSVDMHVGRQSYSY